MNSIVLNLRAARAPSAARTVLYAGVLGAALDLMFAFVWYGVRHGISPQRILQTIGSGILGTASFDGGWSSASLGFVCHFFIVIVAAWWFFLAARRLPWLVRQPFAAGIAYGIAIYLVMNYVVVPLSAAPHFKRSLVNTVAELVSHLFFVGLSISYIVRRHFRAA